MDDGRWNRYLDLWPFRSVFKSVQVFCTSHKLKHYTEFFSEFYTTFGITLELYTNYQLKLYILYRLVSFVHIYTSLLEFVVCTMV